MRLTFGTEAEAQAVADRIHADMIEADANYAADVAAGHTLQWAIPYQDRDENGQIVSEQWHVAVNERCRAVLSDDEWEAANPPLQP